MKKVLSISVEPIYHELLKRVGERQHRSVSNLIEKLLLTAFPDELEKIKRELKK